MSILAVFCGLGMDLNNGEISISPAPQEQWVMKRRGREGR